MHCIRGMTKNPIKDLLYSAINLSSLCSSNLCPLTGSQKGIMARTSSRYLVELSELAQARPKVRVIHGLSRQCILDQTSRPNFNKSKFQQAQALFPKKILNPWTILPKVIDGVQSVIDMNPDRRIVISSNGFSNNGPVSEKSHHENFDGECFMKPLRIFTYAKIHWRTDGERIIYPGNDWDASSQS